MMKTDKECRNPCTKETVRDRIRVRDSYVVVETKRKESTRVP